MVRAVVFEQFGVHPAVRDVSDPVCPRDGMVVGVEATGLCRSDWHGWMGHDPDIALPHVRGTSSPARVVAVGRGRAQLAVGDRVTAPFVCACGRCPTCQRGEQQVCDNQQQPGFTHWGSFADFVVVDAADVNGVRLPDGWASTPRRVSAAASPRRIARSWRTAACSPRTGSPCTAAAGSVCRPS